MRMIDLGATTLWENWYGTSGANSLDHPMFGSVEQWFYRHILGIQVDECAVGCNKVRIDPKPFHGVDWAEGWLDTPIGRISVSWKLIDGKPKVAYSVPKGVDAIVSRKAD